MSIRKKGHFNSFKLFSCCCLLYTFKKLLSLFIFLVVCENKNWGSRFTYDKEGTTM